MKTKLCALAIGVASLACGGAASANVLILGPAGFHQYQQTVQSPCVFSNPSCQNGSFASTALPTGGGITGYDSLSPLYTGQTLLDIIGAGNSLMLGIDINQGGAVQTLTAFTMSLNGTVVDTFSGTSNNVPALANGNGYADYVLSGFSSFGANDKVQFHFVFNDANDGTENVFVIGGPPSGTVPEPATLALLGLGLLGTSLARRRGSSPRNEESA